MKELLFGGEVTVEDRRGDPDLGHDVDDAGALCSLCGRRAGSDSQDRLPDLLGLLGHQIDVRETPAEARPAKPARCLDFSKRLTLAFQPRYLFEQLEMGQSVYTARLAAAFWAMGSSPSRT